MSADSIRINQENVKKKLLYAKIIIWLSVLLTLLSLTIRDMVKLGIRYQQSEPITLVKAKDDSSNGIRLPNATLCVLFRNRMNINGANVKEFNFTNFSYHQLGQTILLARLFNNLDYETTNGKQWKDIEKYVNLRPHTKLFDEQGAKTNVFWNHLSKILCHLLDVRMVTVDNNKMQSQIDVCKMASNGQLPFTANSELMFCFRVPLDLVALKQSQQFNENESTKEKNYVQEIILQFQPLALRLYFPKFDDVLATFLFFPEDPMSYTELEGRKLLLQQQKAQFFHQLEYPKSINYMEATLINVDVSISGKYLSQNSNKRCANVYNEPTCLVKCMEEEMKKICDCHRFIFRHFYFNDDDVRYCNFSDYKNCFDKYKTEKFRPRIVDEKRRCVEECYRCAKIIFQSQISEKQIDWKTQTNDKLMTCNAYKSFIDDVKISCDDFWNTLDSSYLPFLMNGSKYGKNVIRMADGKSNPVYGLLKYKFKIKSFTYPEFVDRISITTEEFTSQIGGIFGLYLGFSGMTVFALITKCIRLCKCSKRIKEKRAKKKSKGFLADNVGLLFNLVRVPNLYDDNFSTYDGGRSRRESVINRRTMSTSLPPQVSIEMPTDVLIKEIDELRTKMSVLETELSNLKNQLQPS